MQNYSIINNTNLINFVSAYAYEYVGIADGKQTTLSDEMAMIAKAVTRADVCRISVDPYRSRLAYAMAELTEKEKMEYAADKYRRAAKKILWLNSICKSRMGFTFLAKRIDVDSMDEIEELVDTFEAAIRFAATGNNQRLRSALRAFPFFLWLFYRREVSRLPGNYAEKYGSLPKEEGMAEVLCPGLRNMPPGAFFSHIIRKRRKETEMGSAPEIFTKITIIVYTVFALFAFCHLVKGKVRPPDIPVVGTGYAIVLWPAGIAGLILALKYPGENGLLSLLFLAAVFAAQFRVVMEDLLYFKTEIQVSHLFAIPGALGLLLAAICFAMDLAMLLTAFVPMAASVILAVAAVVLLLFLCFGGFVLSLVVQETISEAVEFLLLKSGKGGD